MYSAGIERSFSQHQPVLVQYGFRESVNIEATGWNQNIFNINYPITLNLSFSTKNSAKDLNNFCLWSVWD